jgi:hypothetical protein
MSRNTIRSVLVFIIVLTIPCYLLGIGIWLFSPGGNSTQVINTPGSDSGGRPTITPRDPFANVTSRPTLTDVSDAPGIFPTNTPGFQPVAPSPQAFATFTPIWTATPIPTNTTPPTNTPLPTSTPLPTATQPIILPPTNTPNP